MSECEKESFFDAWRTYAKVVEGDYMFHREIGAAVGNALRARFGDRPFSLLDLGCGDAATLAPTLAGLTLSRYKGVDLSATALDIARENLKALPCPVELAKADLLDGLAEDGAFDAIHASFSLHHLPTELKAEFFRRAAALYEEGVSLIGDADYVGALGKLSKALEIDPSFADAHKAMGVCYAHLQEADKGAYHYEQYLKLNPGADDAAQVRRMLTDFYKTQANE